MGYKGFSTSRLKVRVVTTTQGDVQHRPGITRDLIS